MKTTKALLSEALAVAAMAVCAGCGATGNADQSRFGEMTLENGHPSFQILRMPGGVRFGLSEARPARPAPLLLVFSSTLEQALGQVPYNDTGKALAGRGWLSASLDLPCHGQQRKPGEPKGLRGWHCRLDRGEDPLKGFVARVAGVLDSLIAGGWVDPKRIAVCGTSRGASSAMHLAARERRIQCVAAFSPVTELRAVQELDGMARPEAAAQLALIHTADALAGRPVFASIGDQDRRVSTDHAIAFARSLSAASARRNGASRIELHVAPLPKGVEGHHTPYGAHEKAAERDVSQSQC